MNAHEERLVRAAYTAKTITVYRAYSPAIADAAARAGRFVAPFSRQRMTWIKPSFGWMMYRCGWGRKPGQERILAIEISRDGFEWALAHPCLSHFSPGTYDSPQAWEAAKASSSVRVQWDPDRSLVHGRPACKGEDKTSANYLFLGPKRGHPRRSNYADDFLTPAAEGQHPARQGARRPVYVTAEPWPGIPVRCGNRRNRAADLADGTWPNLIGKFHPHDYRHSHATWLDTADVSKVIQMDRRGHTMQGMDRVYMHVTLQMRQRFCDILEELWRDAVAQRYKIDAHSHIALLDRILRTHTGHQSL